MVALRREDEAFITSRRRGARRSRPPVRLGATAIPPLPLVRRDTLPENASYPDAGCDLFASCLRCPLARCRYDVAPGGLRRLVTEARDREIAFIRRRHRAPIAALAATYGLTRRSIFRILRLEAGREKREAGSPRRTKQETDRQQTTDDQPSTAHR